MLCLKQDHDELFSKSNEVNAILELLKDVKIDPDYKKKDNERLRDLRGDEKGSAGVD